MAIYLDDMDDAAAPQVDRSILNPVHELRRDAQRHRRPKVDAAAHGKREQVRPVSRGSANGQVVAMPPCNRLRLFAAIGWDPCFLHTENVGIGGQQAPERRTP
jgi:hypothetical protein